MGSFPITQLRDSYLRNKDTGRMKPPGTLRGNPDGGHSAYIENHQPGGKTADRPRKDPPVRDCRVCPFVAAAAHPGNGSRSARRAIEFHRPDPGTAGPPGQRRGEPAVGDVHHPPGAPALPRREDRRPPHHAEGGGLGRQFRAGLAGAPPATDLSVLAITGVTFDQNAAGDPITSAPKLYQGYPRFVIMAVKGAGITITGDKFLNTNNVNTIVTGSATSNVTISGNTFTGVDLPWHDHSSIYTSGTGAVISNNTFTGTRDIAAIEVHGDKAAITGNTIRGYYRGANIVASDTTFTANTITGALGPVDLWSTVAPGLHNVTVTGNTLNQDLHGWAAYLKTIAIPMPTGVQTQQVFRQPTSTLPFSRITIRGNRG